ncbi:MAG: ABC transporter ATP-binding protein [Chloroflexi bacterium]|nr:ABC transporter ATP-binding protein [Chloroflexota bacterium]
MNSAPILQTVNLAKHFGGLKAVDGINLSVAEGSLHAIIGPNGAGKTTLFHLISGHLPPTRGQVILRGKDVTGMPAHRLVHYGLGRSFQITNIFPDLTVQENVRLAAQAVGGGSLQVWRHYRAFPQYLEQAMAVIEQLGLADQSMQMARTLPHGGKRKLELAILLVSDPDILLLDEPTAGMASEDVPELMSLIEHIRRASGKTILLVEHNMNVVMRVSDRITVMHQGHVLAEGTPAEVATNEEVLKAYLGELYDAPDD